MTDLDMIGLDYDSARDATPRWFGVSFGNGNDGVSHLFPDYHVRTTDAYALARVAMVATFLAHYQEQAAEAVEIDGETDYTVYAIIYNPLDDEPDEDGEDYCSSNGAWLICEVFPDEPADSEFKAYGSMEEAFTAAELRYAQD